MDACFTLHLDNAINIFKVKGDSAFAFFAEHALAELQVTGIDVVAAGVEAAHVHSEEHGSGHDEDHDDDLDAAASTACVTEKEKDKKWGDAMGAAIIVNICTLLGVVILALSVLPMMKDPKNKAFLQVCVGADCRAVPIPMKCISDSVINPITCVTR